LIFQTGWELQSTTCEDTNVAAWFNNNLPASTSANGDLTDVWKAAKDLRETLNSIFIYQYPELNFQGFLNAFAQFSLFFDNNLYVGTDNDWIGKDILCLENARRT
jgi:hypothetical protein